MAGITSSASILAAGRETEPADREGAVRLPVCLEILGTGHRAPQGEEEVPYKQRGRMPSRLQGSTMYVSGFDHIAIPGQHIEEALRFYRSMGFTAPSPEEWRENPTRIVAIRFGNNKINIHTPHAWEDPDFTLRGHKALPGCGDICFVWDGSINELRETLKRANAPIEAGPVELNGARRNGTARGVSVYTRDPDQNLLEFIVYESA